MCVCTCTCVSICTCIHVYVYVYVCMCIRRSQRWFNMFLVYVAVDANAYVHTDFAVHMYM